MERIEYKFYHFYHHNKVLAYSLGVLVFFLAASTLVQAQDNHWTNYTAGQKATGVVENESTVWVATTGGLAEVTKASDAVTFHTHANSGLPGNYLTGITMDSQGKLWISTHDTGVITYDNGHWMQYQQSNSNLETDLFTDIAVGRGDTVWASADNGIYRYDGQSWTRFQTPNYSQPDVYYCVAPSGNGTVWVGMKSYGLASFQTDSPTNWTEWQDDSTNPLDFYNVRSVAVNSDGRVWVGSENGELGVWNGTAWTVYDWSSSDLPGGALLALDFSSANDVWIGMEEDGLTHYDGSTWTTYNTGNSDIASHDVEGLSVNSDGVHWIGTGTGLEKFDGSTWTPYETYNSGLQLTSQTNQIAFDSQGNAWIGNGDGFADDGYGLVKFDGSSWSIFNTSNSDIPNNTVLSIVVDNSDRIWAGTADGLGIYDGSSWEVYSGYDSPIPAEEVRDITITSDGTAWIAAGGFNNGVASFDGTSWTSYTSSNSGLPDADVTSIAVDSNGIIWIGTERKGLIRFDGSTWQQFRAYDSDIAQDEISDLLVGPDNNLYVAFDYDDNTYGGFGKFDGTVWTNFLGVNSAFPSGHFAVGASSLAMDAAGNLWIGSDGGGLVQYDGRSIQVFTSAQTGLSSDKVYGVSVDSQGQKWIANGASGVDVLDGAAKPVVDFTAYPREGNGSLNATFRDKSSNSPNSWVWEFPGGNPSSSTEQNPTVTYSSAGTYEVTLSVSNVYGEDEIVQSSFIQVHPDDYTPASAWQIYTSGSFVNGVAEDGDTLWTATNGGLVRMNKNSGETTVYTVGNSPLKSNSILDIAIDNNGTKWAATGHGLVKISGNSWTVYDSDNSDLYYDLVTQVEAASDGTIWFATLNQSGFSSSNGGLISYDGSTFTRHTRSENTGGVDLPGSQINVIAIDQQGTIWIGLDDDGVATYDGSDFTVYNASNSDLRGNSVQAIAFDQNNEAWIGLAGLNVGLSHFDGSNWTIYGEDNSDIPDDYVQSIDVDANGMLWFGTQARGMVSFNGNVFTSYNTVNSGLPSDNINLVHIGNNGKFWIGTKLLSDLGELSGEPGLTSWDRTSWERHNVSNSGLPSNYTNAVYSDSRGNIWISAQSSAGFFGDPLRGGLVQYDHTQWQVYQSSNSGMPISTVTTMEEGAHGHLWVADKDDETGAIRFDGSEWTSFTTSNSAVPSDYVYDYAMDRQGNLWIATLGGLVQFADSIKAVYSTSNSDIPGEAVSAVATDGSGGVWVGTQYSGVARYNAQTDSWTSYDSGDQASLGNQVDRIVAAAPNDVYLVTSDFISTVLLHFDGTEWTEVHTGLSSKEINDMLFDADGNLWLGSGPGFTSNGGVLMKYDGSSFTSYTADNSGFTGDGIEAMSLDTNGDMWLATQGGVIVFRGEDAISTGIQSSEPGNLPERFALDQNYPNPFNPTTGIRYALPQQSRVRLIVYNLLGKQVADLVNRTQKAGWHTIQWDASQYASGIYFYRLITPEFTTSKKMMLVK